MEPQEDIRTLNKAEALVVKANNPALNPWRVVVWQVVATGLTAVAAGLLWWPSVKLGSVVLSVIWGGLCVVLPAALFARGMMSKATLLNAGTATAGFFLWELVKIATTLAMLFAATKVLRSLGQDLNWLALLVGLIVVMKVYWLALLCKPKVSLVKDN